jgi:DedD protein
MGLFSFIKRQGGATPATATADAVNAVDSARTRARRRLIGAVVLLGIGVIAFPLLFETHPRPIPVDIAIEIPRKDGAPALAVPPPRPAAGVASKPVAALPVITESKADAGKAVVTEAKAPPPPKPEAAAKPVAPKVEARVETAPAAPPSSRAEKAEPPVAEAKGRFVVQIGAFADAAVAREARSKVEKLGLRTYTQAVETESGTRTRVRLGPFGSRDEAEAAAAKVKAAGLPAAVLTL